MNDTQTIKDRIDIVQLIGEYVKLKKAGVNWRANCPFHHEKTPSFMVHPEKQIWHCFGCGKGGDAFTFVQEIEGLEFIETLKLLAKRVGVELKTHRSESDSNQRNRLIEINVAVARFFHHLLTVHPAGQGAREYLKNRGLTNKTIVEWQIGYAPEQWDLLTKYLLNKGFGIDDAVLAGVTIKKEGADVSSGRGYYDRFRGRIMFPICDAHGTIIGFTGRILVESSNSGGKYVNTPQTALYDKSRVLYGLSKAKTDIKGQDLAVIVEGQMDVIACHQAGMTNVVAASGTALTLEQIKLLKRYTNNVAMAFDADAAGQNAGKRGSEIALEEGMRVRVIQLPKNFAKDADECLKKDPAVWFKAVAEAPELMEWYFRNIIENLGKNPAGKQKAVNELLPRLARLPFAIEREEWLKRLGNEIGVDIGVLREEIKKIKLTPNHHDNLSAGSLRLEMQSPMDSLLQEFWSVIIKFPLQYQSIRELLLPQYCLGSNFSRLYEEAEKMYTTLGKLDIEKMRIIFNGENPENIIDVLLLRPYKIDDLTEAEAAAELKELIKRLKAEWRQRRGRELERQIAAAEERGETERVQNFLKELNTLTS